jgi:hypothetical protein
MFFTFIICSLLLCYPLFYVTAQKAVRKGDLMGWGMVYPEEDQEAEEEDEQLVVCYLTINRDVALTRVMYQPPGGFYPVVLMPPGGELLFFFLHFTYF